MPRSYTAETHASSPQIAPLGAQSAAPSSRVEERPGAPRLPRTAQRRIVFWDPSSADDARQAKWRGTAAAFARDGFQVVVAGPAPASWNLELPYIAAPPQPDELPDAFLTDADPAATIAGFGLNGSELLLADAGLHGLPMNFGHALRRLRALAWTARWVDQWIASVEPDVIVVVPSERDATSMIIESIARLRHVRLATSDDAVNVATAAPLRGTGQQRRAMAEACRSTNEWITR